MSLDKNISCEEFDKRLEVANEQRCQERLEREGKHQKMLQLVAWFGTTLDEIEARLDAEPDSPDVFAWVRGKLNQLAERSREVAAAL